MVAIGGQHGFAVRLLSDALLKDLIEHFSRISFDNQNIASDVLGDAYEYLIKKFGLFVKVG